MGCGLQSSGRFDLDFILFEEEPHQAVEYALFLVGRWLGVKTVMSVRTISQLGILPVFDFTQGMPELNERYQALKKDFQQGQVITIDKPVEDYFSKLNADYQTVLKDHLWNQVDGYNSLAGGGSSLVQSVKKYLPKLRSAVEAFGRFLRNALTF